MTGNFLVKMFFDSYFSFIKNEKENILSNVNERSICGRLAIYLNDKIRNSNLEGYFVDVEYNRNYDGKIKTIIDEDLHITNINCDLIVHSRGNNIQQDNLIAIEMKKSSRPEQEKNNDRKRLRAMTKKSCDKKIWSYDGKTLPEHVCGYVIGMYIEIDIARAFYLIECYSDGEYIKNWQGEF